MRKSITNRIKVTKTGKVLRRAMGQCHFRSKKRTIQIKRRKTVREITDLNKKIVKKYL
jgi:ribosomal protein L35